MIRGKIIGYSPDSGNGFIKSNDIIGVDIYFKLGGKKWRVGDSVEFRVKHVAHNKLYAIDLKNISRSQGKNNHQYHKKDKIIKAARTLSVCDEQRVVSLGKKRVFVDRIKDYYVLTKKILLTSEEQIAYYKNPKKYGTSKTDKTLYTVVVEEYNDNRTKVEKKKVSFGNMDNRKNKENAARVMEIIDNAINSYGSIYR